MSERKIKVTLIAGGVGGAKMAEGFAALDNVELHVIGNIADDDEFHGLWVSPDIDTLTYTLADAINRKQGWGVSGDTLQALNVLEILGEPTWMTLGDKDFGLHIYRTMRRLRGDRPSEIARDVADKLGVRSRIILPTDDVVKTMVRTVSGWISFQEYFVRERCAPEVLELAYEGIETARATPEAITAIRQAELIVLAPSNPLVSIAPILKVAGIEDEIASAPAPVFAVSPLIAGKVVKGPADRMMASLGLRADVVGIVERYRAFCDFLVMDHADATLCDEVRTQGADCLLSSILMKDIADKTRLADEILSWFHTEKTRRVA